MAASCARQCGKNHTVIRLLVLIAMGIPGANCVYVNATHNEARTVMWSKPKKSLPATLQHLGLQTPRDYTLNHSAMTVTFANGSLIRLRGADTGGAPWERLLGDELDVLVVDEAQKLDDDPFRDALDRIIPDLFNARGGSCVLIGTPDPFCVGEFHDICTGAARTFFRHHHWDAEDLRDLTDVWANQLAEKAREGLADDDPRWLRDKRGLWVRADDRLMLPLTEAGLWDGTLPPLIPSAGGPPVRRSQPPEAYAGLDFGWTDAAALVVLSFSREEGVIREVRSEKRTELNTQQLADWVRQATKEHGVRRIYCDAAEPKTIEDLRALHRLPVVAAEKHDKEPWISEMRACALAGKLRILRGSPLHGELRVLAPDPAQLLKRRLSTRPGSDDHCWDALRYCFRGIRENHFRAPEPPMSADERAIRDVALHREEQLGLRRPQHGSRDDIRSIRLAPRGRT